MYRLSTSLPYLIARLGIRAGDLFARVIKEDGLSLAMYRVLAALTEVARPLRLNELAVRTSVDLSTLSRAVAEMHRRGLVQRERPQNDQRSIQVTLREPGRVLAARYMPVASHYEKVAAKSLSPKAIESLRATLNELYDNLDELEREVDDGTIERLIRQNG